MYRIAYYGVRRGAFEKSKSFGHVRRSSDHVLYLYLYNTLEMKDSACGGRVPPFMTFSYYLVHDLASLVSRYIKLGSNPYYYPFDLPVLSPRELQFPTVTQAMLNVVSNQLHS